MKTKKFLIIGFVLSFFQFKFFAQIDSLEGFNEEHAWAHTQHLKTQEEKKAAYEQIKRMWIKRKYNLFPKNPENNSFSFSQKVVSNNPDILQGPQPSGCNNIDFEAGNTTGWTMTNTSSGSGFYQVVNSGVDMWGGFPMVYPGGNYSLRLGTDWGGGCNCNSSSMGAFCTSQAQRVIPVTSANAQFALHFAFVVYNFPHSPSDAAYVEIKLLGPSGNQLPCPYFKVYWDGNSNQFVGLSGATPQFGGIDTRCNTGCTNCNVTYLPWTTVNVDLSPYIGQNVTLQASVHWCVYQVDWAYAYIDADCTSSTFSIPPACAGSNVCAPGGFASYNWSIPGGGSATGQCITTTVPGIYTVVCNPIIACSAPQTVTVSVGGGFTTNITSTNVSCYSGSNGSASVSTTGATPPLSYTWAPSGGNSALATGLSPGIYTVTVQDASCSKIATVQISQPTAYTLSSITQTASCSSPGSATINVSGATPAYSYTWSPSGGNSNIATGLSVGNYTCTIKDANNCFTTAVVNITGAPTVSITSINTNSVTCNGGSNGIATVNVNGGATPYSYTWIPSVSSNFVASGLSAGNYSVIIMDNNNCATNAVINIPQPPALSLTATQTQSVSCNGGNNGSASATASGGVGGYTYTWSPSGGNSSSASGLSFGTYTISVLDANNCPISTTVQIQEPPALSLTASQTQSVSCNGGNNGIASATASGGVGGYTYTWSPSGGNSSTATNLTAGYYTVTISDANLCGPISQTVQILQPPALSISVSGQSVTCFGYANGSATASVSGGIPPYSYNWTPSAATSSIVTGLLANNYTVNVTDVNNCFISASINIPQPSSVSLISSPNQTICYGNSTNIFANASGGTPPYTYNWNNNLPNTGGPHFVTLTSTTIYTVQAVDAQNCLSPTNSIKITVLPALLATGMTTTICDGNSAAIYPTITSPGNGGPYSYLWNNAQTNATISVVGNYALGAQNIYTVTITDGCSVPDAVTTITVNVFPNPVISFSANPLSGCVPLTVSYFGSSDGSNDTFSWNFDNGQSSNQQNPLTTYTISGSFSPSLTVTNSYGCSSSTFIPNYINVYPLPIADFSADPWGTTIITPTINFFNSSVGASQYLWNFGDYASPTNTSSAVNPSHEYTYSGTYTVMLIATNQYGCKDFITKVITIDPEFHLYIPNVFTPDGNGLNDVFQPKGVGIDENDYKMLIFDRWGELIFQSNNFNKGWDGSVKGSLGKATQDVYVYKIYVKDLKGNRHEFVGHVTCLPNNEQ